MGLLRTLAVALVALALPAAVGAATSLNLTPNPVQRGHVVVITGSIDPACPVGATVTIISGAFVHTNDFAGLPAVYAKVKAGGKISKATKIPATRHPGKYNVGARCGGGNLGVSKKLHVTA